MDKKQAKFILHSFRPDGAADTDFAEALRLTAEDRELGEWLASERTMDAALSEVEIAGELRQNALAVMREEKPSDDAATEELDNILRNALEEVQPPANLRDQIIAAMEIQEGRLLGTSGHATPNSNVSKRNWFKIAAAVVLGSAAAFQMTSGSFGNNRLTTHDIQQEAAQLLNADFIFDMENPDRDKINTWLVGHELPIPSNLPPGLREMKSLGCKEIRLPGDKRASMLCFVEDTGGIVHLIIIKNDHVSDHHDLPTLDKVSLKNCYHCPETHWNVARWQNQENTFILLAKKILAKNEILQYFYT